MKKKKLHFPWIGADDPDNFHRGVGYAPTPEEIEIACRELRKLEDSRMLDCKGGIDERSSFRPRTEFSMPDVSRKPLLEFRLCDCPYWGTEY